MSTAANETKHTPGPWMLTLPNGCAVSSTVGSKKEICQLTVASIYDDARYDWKPSEQEAEANARLIASAPELLYATHEAFAVLEACELILRPKTERARLSRAIEQARAALAKAEGRA